MKTATREQVVKAARSYVGIPYLLNGRSREGMDCAGVVVLVAADFGLALNFPPWNGTVAPRLDHVLESLEYRGFTELPRPEEGCLAIGTINNIAVTGCAIVARIGGPPKLYSGVVSAVTGDIDALCSGCIVEKIAAPPRFNEWEFQAQLMGYSLSQRFFRYPFVQE